MRVQQGVHVVTVSYWSSSQLSGMLAELAGRFPVTVVDNADGTDIETQRVSAGHDYVAIGHNSGFGSACNVGARRSSSAYVLFLNPDCRVSPSTVDALVSLLDRRPDAGACAPRLGRRQIYGGAAPGFWSAVGYLALPDALLGSRCVWATATRARGPVAVGWASGACLLVRREAFDAVGGFREDLFMYNEDLDLSARLRRSGWCVLVDPRLSADHAGAQSSVAPVDTANSWSRSTLRYLGRSWRSTGIAAILGAGMWRRHLVALAGGRRRATFAPEFTAQLLRRRTTTDPAADRPERCLSTACDGSRSE
ncbi:MAG: glycosyltransferase family 2 protein [Hamadaea sp.]|nr:glycosyltransferase family 2 protein [Hamadaea sp.]NUT04538.1 glycosyltransferase family 2 protein [Hamadaea sp.]